ncbi:hypothetical protein D3C87_1161980 [compost metagenome]
MLFVFVLKATLFPKPLLCFFRLNHNSNNYNYLIRLQFCYVKTSLVQPIFDRPKHMLQLIANYFHLKFLWFLLICSLKISRHFLLKPKCIIYKPEPNHFRILVQNAIVLLRAVDTKSILI